MNQKDEQSPKFLLLGFDISKWKPNDIEWKETNEFINDPIENKRIGNFMRPNNNGGWSIGKDNDNAKSSMSGRRLMIELVKNMLSLDYDSIKFKRTESNKPYLSTTNSKKFSFNVSHDSNWVIAIGSLISDSIGIDIMDCKIPRNQKINEFFDSMRSCFTDNEWRVIDQGTDDQNKVNLFFIHWCLKESYIKADGKGLNIELRSFEFIIDQTNQTAQIILLDNKNNSNNNKTPLKNFQFTYFKPFKNDQNHKSFVIAICLDLTNSNINNTNNDIQNNLITKENLSIQILDSDFKIK
ncbi:hypothetical protein RB653_000495 [Dictyostelium firmibasis]|uniref:holo-[acyl-carrier-protein] synthase n=1 Tax=Dictyostelium firmibasis TaxID=79012 RepID=A0AAN7YXX9_9MYCE